MEEITSEQLAEMHNKPPMMVDVHNNFLGLGEDGEYHSIPPTQIVYSSLPSATFKTFIFGAAAVVEMKDGNYEQASQGDMLTISADGSHRIVPPLPKPALKS